MSEIMLNVLDSDRTCHGRVHGCVGDRIVAALARIEDGEFGWCVGCGEAIAPKRLENDPAAPNCIGCAGKA